MNITINTKKVTDFVRRHPGAISVAAIAVLVNHKQAKRISSLNNFLGQKGLFEEYYDFN